MKIDIYIDEDYDHAQTEKMVIDDKERLNVYPLTDCPEDAIVERDLVSCQDVAKFMKEAYEAGLRGEDFLVRKITNSPSASDNTIMMANSGGFKKEEIQRMNR